MKAIVKTPTLAQRKYPLQIFDNFFNRSFPELWKDGWMETVPSVNIHEGKDNFKVKLAAPGLKKEDFKVNVEENMVTISAQKESTETEEKEGKITSQEYNYSAFSRSFTLPESIENDKIVATYKDGILTLELPKKVVEKQKETHEITVK